MPMTLRILVPLLCGIAVACASATGGRRATCDLSPSDSVLAQGRPVFRDCNVDRPARFLNNAGARPNLPSSAASMRSACYSADLEFVVDSTGRPETATARLVRTNNQDFAQAVLETIGVWRYEPALRDGTPVRQIVTTHQAASMMVVVAPAGSGPPAGRPPNMPRC